MGASFGMGQNDKGHKMRGKQMILSLTMQYNTIFTTYCSRLSLDIRGSAVESHGSCHCCGSRGGSRVINLLQCGCKDRTHSLQCTIEWGTE